MTTTAASISSIDIGTNNESNSGRNVSFDSIHSNNKNMPQQQESSDDSVGENYISSSVRSNQKHHQQQQQKKSTTTLSKSITKSITKSIITGGIMKSRDNYKNNKKKKMTGISFHHTTAFHNKDMDDSDDDDDRKRRMSSTKKKISFADVASSSSSSGLRASTNVRASTTAIPNNNEEEEEDVEPSGRIVDYSSPRTKKKNMMMRHDESQIRASEMIERPKKKKSVTNSTKTERTANLTKTQQQEKNPGTRRSIINIVNKRTNDDMNNNKDENEKDEKSIHNSRTMRFHYYGSGNSVDADIIDHGNSVRERIYTNRNIKQRIKRARSYFPKSKRNLVSEEEDIDYASAKKDFWWCCARKDVQIVRNLDRVIFPYSKIIRRWDKLNLCILIFYLLIVPFELGVTGVTEGSLMRFTAYMYLMLIFDVILIIDSFLYFNRAYRGKDGKLVVNLRKIRGHYLRGAFIPYFIANIAAILQFALLLFENRGSVFQDKDWWNEHYDEFWLVLGINIAKLLRLSRFNVILSQSQAVINFRMKRNSQYVQLIVYCICIFVAVHVISCLWCAVAYLYSGGTFAYDKDHLLKGTTNWIYDWYENEYDLNDTNNTIIVINPTGIGISNAIDRYMIAFFWASQTITSIGYGTITPTNRAEWVVGSIIQLIAGVAWAYIIGGLIAITSGLNKRKEEFDTRTDEATELINNFRTENEVYIRERNDRQNSQRELVVGKKKTALRIRKYIYEQHKLSTNTACTNNILNYYPVLQTLPPGLQEQASILLYRHFLDRVPYLNSQFLGMREQARIALQVVQLEFPAGEVIYMNKGVHNLEDGYLGKGVYYIESGCAQYRKMKGRRLTFLTVGNVVNCGRVLLEDNHPSTKGSRLSFLSYSKVLFIPQEAIFNALDRNAVAWKESARWVYARTVLGHSDVQS